jgi:hypothetical protein
MHGNIRRWRREVAVKAPFGYSTEVLPVRTRNSKDSARAAIQRAGADLHRQIYQYGWLVSEPRFAIMHVERMKEADGLDQNDRAGVHRAVT